MNYEKKNAREIRAKCKQLDGVLCCVSFKPSISGGKMILGPMIWGYIELYSAKPFRAYLRTLKKNRIALMPDQIEFITKCACAERDICLGEI